MTDQRQAKGSLFLPPAARAREMKRLRGELGANGFVEAFLLAMREYDPTTRVRVTITRPRSTKGKR